MATSATSTTVPAATRGAAKKGGVLVIFVNVDVILIEDAVITDEPAVGIHGGKEPKIAEDAANHHAERHNHIKIPGVNHIHEGSFIITHKSAGLENTEAKNSSAEGKLTSTTD